MVAALAPVLSRAHRGGHRSRRRRRPANLVLRERNFRYALLNRSDFHRADLTWADLRAAQLWRTCGSRASSTTPKLQGAVLKEAELQGAQLASASLQGADLQVRRASGRRFELRQTSGREFKRGAASGRGSEWRPASGRGPARRPASGCRFAKAPSFEGAVLTSAEIWLARFPPGLVDQSPAPLGLGRCETVGAHTGGEGAIGAGPRIPKSQTLWCGRVVIARLDPILRQ